VIGVGEVDVLGVVFAYDPRRLMAILRPGDGVRRRLPSAGAIIGSLIWSLRGKTETALARNRRFESSPLQRRVTQTRSSVEAISGPLHDPDVRKDRAGSPVIGAGIDLGIGMQPSSDVIAHQVEECTQFHHLVRALGGICLPQVGGWGGDPPGCTLSYRDV